MKRKLEYTEEGTVQARKMARIEEIQTTYNTSSNIVKKSQGETEEAKKYTDEAANVVFAEYTLNDLNALETKFSLCNVEPIKVSKEAKDGSSIHIDLKTSLFEAMKQNLIPILNTDPDIEKAATRRITKAKSNSGTANVEYLADIVVIKGGNKHEIILKYFTTKCRIQVQKRGKHMKFSDLGDKYVPKFFMDYYIVPLAKKIEACNPNMDEGFVPHLAEEIERLRALNKAPKNINKKAKIPDDAKCINKKCTQKITKNTKSSAQCSSCKNFEHFKCSGTRNIMKEDINDDVVNFFCTVCIDENPSLGLEVTTKRNEGTIVKAIVHRPDIELEEIVEVEDYPKNDATSERFKCDNCGKCFKEHKHITEHIERDHKTKQILNMFKCSECEKDFDLETDLNDHVISSHSHSEKFCDLCQFKSKSQEDLTKHKDDTHEKSQNLQHIQNNDLLANKETQEVLHCEKCDFSTNFEISLETHLKGHMGDEKSEDLVDDLVAENATLKRKYQGILDSYDRLTVMYNTIKEDSKKNVDVYKKELCETQETLRITLSECEKLKETNDIQNNLWKIWLKEHNEEIKTIKPTKNKQSDTEEKEVIEVEEIDEEEDLVTAFLRNKRQGFSRVTPAAPSEQNTKQNSRYTPSEPPKPNDRKRSQNNHFSHNNRSQNTKKYCHYWNNAGTCSYQNCKFSHEKSPVCKFDGRCTRNKCMFTHQKQNKCFLAEKQRAPPSQTSQSSRQSIPVWAQRSPPQYWSPPTPWTQWGNPWSNSQVQMGMGNIRNF